MCARASTRGALVWIGCVRSGSPGVGAHKHEPPTAQDALCDARWFLAARGLGKATRSLCHSLARC
eukprot:m.78831 g.78831  ORF g.78831 m.78831 type:complete len:65 (+) comp17381_c1_seq2:130-324(+)